MSFLAKWRLLAIALPVAVLCFFATMGSSQAGEYYQPGKTRVVRPRSGMGHGPDGRYEQNPYQLWKWYRNESGMIDAINRDYPPVYPRR